MTAPPDARVPVSTSAPTRTPDRTDRTVTRATTLTTGGLLVVGLLAFIGAMAVVHVTQGTSAVGAGDLWDWVRGRADPQTAAIITDSRLPRVAAAVVVGIALGTAGALMQSFARNTLASPDTLAVNASAFLALTVVAVLGIRLPYVGGVGVAFLGGIAGAALVLALAGTAYGTVRLVLAGITLGLMFDAVTTALLIMFPYEARGLFAWSAGSLAQSGYGGLLRMVPIVVAMLLLVALVAKRLDLLALGDDAATTLGVPVRRTQAQMLLISVLLATAAVALVGPIGYVGVVAPTFARLLTGVVPGLHRHAFLVPVSGLMCVALLITADVVVRALVGAQAAVTVPTGVATSLIGAVVMIALATRLRASSVEQGNALDVRGVGLRRLVPVVAVLGVVVVLLVLAGFLVGDRMLLPGDLVVWLRGDAGPIVGGVMGTRPARVIAALLAGIALAVAGTVIQGVTRNPLADPTMIGISGGGAVLGLGVVTFVPGASFWLLAVAAFVGCLLSAGLVFGLAARSGFATDRLVLMGVAVSIGCAAVVTMIILSTDPWNQSRALTWLSGSTYGRSMTHLVPLLLGCVLVIPPLVAAHRTLDLLSVDNDLPVVLGVSPARARAALLLGAVTLVAVAVAAIGVVGFVGLLAPHAARSLVGRRHLRVIPVAALLGGGLLVVGDILGRSVIAPVQLPASLLTALLGAPYFFWLIYAGRRRAAA